MPPKIKRNRLEMKRILRYTIHSIQEKRATLRQERKTILIAADGSGNFTTLTAAVRAFGTVKRAGNPAKAAGKFDCAACNV